MASQRPWKTSSWDTFMNIITFYIAQNYGSCRYQCSWSCVFEARGIKFYDVLTSYVGQPLHLELEPHNQYDSDCVALYVSSAGSCSMLGHLVRESAEYYTVDAYRISIVHANINNSARNMTIITNTVYYLVFG